MRIKTTGHYCKPCRIFHFTDPAYLEEQGFKQTSRTTCVDCGNSMRALPWEGEELDWRPILANIEDDTDTD
jgi:hypothetical protein